MTEKTMRQDLIKASPTNIKLYAIETAGSAPGFADLYYAGEGVSGVVELKVARGIQSITIPYRQGQKRFLITHADHNPRTFVLLYWRGKYILIGSDHNFPSIYTPSDHIDRDTLWEGETFSKHLFSVLLTRR